MKPEILTGISKQVKTNLEFTIFPNPAKEMIGIVIKEKNAEAISVVEIYNASGEIVYSGTFKGQSTQIHLNRLAAGYFNWQQGYGAFSYAKKDIHNVYWYIMNQKEHHKTEKFLDEYVGLLKEFEIDYDERYLFKEPI